MPIYSTVTYILCSHMYFSVALLFISSTLLEAVSLIKLSITYLIRNINSGLSKHIIDTILLKRYI